MNMRFLRCRDEDFRVQGLGCVDWEVQGLGLSADEMMWSRLQGS